MIPSVVILEWAAFGGSLLSVWLYGHSRIYGPVAGICVAVLFVAFGITAEIYAASLSNLIFFGLHFNNLRKGLKMDLHRKKKEIASGFGVVQTAGYRYLVGATDSADRHGSTGPLDGFWRDADWLFCRDGKWRPARPGTFPLVGGTPSRVGRLRAYGNAIVAPQAAEFVKAAMECMP